MVHQYTEEQARKMTSSHLLNMLVSSAKASGKNPVGGTFSHEGAEVAIQAANTSLLMREAWRRFAQVPA